MADNVEFTENAVTARRLAGVVEGVWGKVRTITDKLNTDKAPLESPALTGTPTAPTAADGTNTTQIATTAFVKTAVTQGMAAADALVYKGTVAGGSTGEYGALTPAANKGYVYKISTAGKVDGGAVEVGDMLICNTDDTAAATADNYSTIAANWDIIQGNTEGVVVGPASSTDSHIALFNGATGKLIKDSSKTLADLATVDHVHGNISNDGKIGSTANLAIVTTTSGEITTADLSTSSPVASSDEVLEFIDTVSQDSKGKITATKKTVKVSSTYSGTGTDPVNGTAVKAAVDDLNVSEFGGAGKVITTISETAGKISATAVDYTDIVPAPDADDTLFTGSSDGTTDWQPLEKSAWGTIITDGENNLIDENGNAIMDENEVDLWTTFKGVGFGAERAAADVEGNPIMDTYATKQEVSELGSEVDSKINALDAEVTSNDGTNVQVKVTETAGIITGVNITTDETENNKNKVTAFQATPDDTHYPSEKLVKDSLDSKVPTSLTVNGYSLSSDITITKGDVGLGNVDNTSDDTKKSSFTGAIEDGDTGFVTGDDVYDALASKADLASPALTGTPTAPTAAAGTDTTQIATTAFVNAAVEQGLSTADALIYKGTVAGGSTSAYGALTPAANKGWTYKVTTAGKIDGVAVEVGDMLICNTDETAAATSSNYATIAANWDFVQGNTEGIVVGPASSTDEHVALFSGVTGKLIKDGGALGTAAFKDVPASGDASTTQVVMGDDSRLSDARPPKAHTHGQIQGNGTISDNDIVIHNGDHLIVADSERGDLVCMSALSFDGQTTSKALTPKGTWESFEKPLPTSGSAVDTYAINVSGNATTSTTSESLKKTNLGSVNTLPLSEMCSSTYKAGTFYLKKTSEGGSSYVFGDVTIPNDQWYRFTTSGESASYCTITLDQCAGGSTTSFATYKILMNGNTTTPSQVVRVPYESTTSAVGSTTSPVYVDSSGKIQPCSGSTVTSTEKTTWNNKQNALTYADGKYAINISGNADSATNATNAAYAFDAAPDSALARAIALNADVAYVEYSVGTLSDIKRLYTQGKKLVLITGGSYQTSARYEFQVPLSYLIYDSSNEITQFRWERSADSINSANDVGVVQRWWIATDGWHSDALSVAYATNSSNAGHANAADKATLDGGGADIRGTYTSTVDATTPAVIATPQTQARVLTSVSGSVNADGFKAYHVNSAYVKLSSVWQKALYSPAYLDENGHPLPKYGTVSGAYVSYGLAYGYNGFVCLGCESASAVGIAQADSDGIVNGYFEAEFDVTIWCLNSSRGTMANPPSTVNIVFGVAAVNPSPSAGNYLRGFEFSEAQIQARMTIPYGDPGSESYAHVRLCGNIVGAGYDYRILIGAAHNSRSDMIVFTCAQNYNLKWISNTFPHN